MNYYSLSIIIGVYNPDIHLFERCINSILQQTYKNIEIILIDDGSTQEVADICDLYSEQDSRVRVVHQDNYGVNAKFEIGYSLVTGDYATVVDQDDYLDLEYYATLMKEANESSFDIVDAGYIHHDFRNRQISSKFIGNRVEYQGMEEILQNKNITWHQDDWCRIIKKRCLKQGNEFKLLDSVSFKEVRTFCHIPYAGYNYVETSGSTQNQGINNYNYDYFEKKNNIEYIDKTIEVYPFLKDKVSRMISKSYIGTYDKIIRTKKPYTDREKYLISKYNSIAKVRLEIIKRLNFIDKFLVLLVIFKIIWFPLWLNYKLNIIKR
ncbi:glycosyltransferase family 2 protein [Lactococcus formosensis]|uniref:glycosyltransferase family 2 protein n=1 Tax=Lactococcus formosensis TaxID=1281486 RepID=UPI0002E0E9C5|nr:glycosyltransferase [Lactococcus formosensis]MDG6113164.1 glycosyltransferase [Lactococcus formosensis]MDG6114827.1 glycosyltransferase [Lactococcus formosensis]MDG6120977.1 glycosyltransferase [Lactococcus formosensis]MDG6123899.1 glycosyltransferase [Lactococcus formosensis]MDG6127884.1 glycosyltransferase [Lactococcus formosensis]